MGRTLAEDLAKLPAARREKIERRAAELIAEEMSLRELRRALGRTQVKVAKDLKIGQHAVSRLESRADMLISTLDRYISKAGGRLVLVVEFPDRKPVRLRGLGDIATQARGVQRRAATLAWHGPDDAPQRLHGARGTALDRPGDLEPRQR
jgi:transcriptional regulator with XRE-family HTH domain